MTEEELMKEILIDDDPDEKNSDVESIPSDVQSLIDGNLDQPNEADNEDFDISITDSEAEDNVPLAEILRRQTNMEHQNQSIPRWDKNYQPLQSISEFSSEFGVPEFIKDLDNPDPVTLFQLFFTDEFLEFIAYQTNLYAQQEGKPFKPTDKIEMKMFIAINLLMGIKKSPSYRDYWSSSPLLNDPYISSLMPCKRFSWLLSNLHLNDNSLLPPRADPQFDKLYKIRPLLTHLQDRFQECFLLSEHVSIDDTFQGKVHPETVYAKKTCKEGI